MLGQISWQDTSTATFESVICDPFEHHSDPEIHHQVLYILLPRLNHTITVHHCAWGFTVIQVMVILCYLVGSWSD